MRAAVARFGVRRRGSPPPTRFSAPGLSKGLSLDYPDRLSLLRLTLPVAVYCSLLRLLSLLRILSLLRPLCLFGIRVRWAAGGHAISVSPAAPKHGRGSTALIAAYCGLLRPDSADRLARRRAPADALAALVPASALIAAHCG